MVSILDSSSNYLNPIQIKYSLNFCLFTQIHHNCSCQFKINYQWEINEINTFNGSLISNLSVLSYPSSNLDYLNITNGTLKYGLYKFIFKLNLIPTNNPTLIIQSTAFCYIKIISSGYILSAFDSDVTSDYKLSVGLLDTIAFVPAFYSKDLDNLVMFNKLSYNYYCILEDLNTNLQVEKSFDDDLHSIKPDDALTNEQINWVDTCFKTKSMKFYLNFLFKKNTNKINVFICI